MTLGKSPTSEDAFRSGTSFCRDHVSETSLYALLYRESHRLFPDEAFADLFADIGRASVPPRIVSVVMVLQRLEGLSDREAVDRITFDLRWKYAAGGLDFDYAGFVHTVLVDMRARLRRSERPNRIFEIALEVAREAGLIGRKRVLDSTALYDAVATQDTVTLIRSAIRALLRIVDDKLGAELRSCCKRDDDYVAAGKPSCDWDDVQAREALVDALARDAHAVVALLDGRTLAPEILQAAKLVATVVGQDLEQRDDGMFRIARRVAKDRVISTVDPEARHGHKTAARGFDGYKGHIAVDPDSEIITGAEVGPANGADGEMLPELVPEFMDDQPGKADALPGDNGASAVDPTPAPAVYGDSAYGAGAALALLARIGVDPMVKVQAPHAPGGRFAKDRFLIDLDAGVVTCPNAVTVPIRPLNDGGGYASFGKACRDCPLRARCTTAKDGRVIAISPHEALLQEARQRQADPAWQADYRATRPKVERKIGHLMRRRHGGRRARVRGELRIGQDWKLLSAAANLARLAVLRVASVAGGWAVAPI